MICYKTFRAIAVRRGWCFVGIALVLGTACLPAASPLQPFMPRAEDFTLLWWANGPQRFHTMKTPPPEAVLRLQSGILGVTVDTRTIRLLRAAR